MTLQTFKSEVDALLKKQYSVTLNDVGVDDVELEELYEDYQIGAFEDIQTGVDYIGRHMDRTDTPFGG